MVAALLNVETLKEWKDRSYSKTYFARGLECLLEVVKIFEDKNNPPPLECPVRETFDKNSSSNEISINNTSQNAGLRQLSRLMRSNSSQDIENLQDKKVQEEINLFSSLIIEIEIESTKKLWIEYKNRLPYLFF